mmetsp:Transcript_102532/g.293550  ORF Transcript_102532/g.293550 Transcript_102532/m.293550 type:complete len:267 (+) Transcript_102532:236-1036(+)
MAWFEQGAKPLGATAEEAPTAQGGITSAEVEKWERERNQALQEADQALSTGNATMGTLADQQETLDRAELIAESNEYMLAKSRRTLRGMTWSGWVANMVSSEPEAPRGARERRAGDSRPNAQNELLYAKPQAGAGRGGGGGGGGGAPNKDWGGTSANAATGGSTGSVAQQQFEAQDRFVLKSSSAAAVNKTTRAATAATAATTATRAATAMPDPPAPHPPTTHMPSTAKVSRGAAGEHRGNEPYGYGHVGCDSGSDRPSQWHDGSG